MKYETFAENICLFFVESLPLRFEIHVLGVHWLTYMKFLTILTRNVQYFPVTVFYCNVLYNEIVNICFFLPSALLVEIRALHKIILNTGGL